MPDWMQQIFTSEWVGWFATALFALSYIVRKEINLLYVQAVAACIWITYGLAHNAMPVVLANVIVASSATFKALRMRANGNRSL